jgi:DNA polymerase-3 subunit gamma/tau
LLFVKLFIKRQVSFVYLALYRKYRSTTFDEVVSQDHITTTLKNQIKTGKLAHAYLFTGSRGTGKTTCAKLMAKAVNCLTPKDGNPCGECEICKAIAAGCSDIIEMDAASNNSVDDVRMLRDEVMYSPVQCKYKVYIIDEVHMMSPSAFNALLKTIEEPPAHVIFILATTETHKVPATIVSRCQQFRFRRIDQNASSERLCEIARREGAELTRPAADLISRLSDGGMRDAISLLDQCISVSRSVDETVVRDTAGVAGTEQLFDIAECAKTGNVAYALKILDELHNASKDVILFLEELMNHFRNLCMLSSMNMDFSLIPAGSGDKNALAQQTNSFTQGEIMRCIEILQDYIAKAPRATNRKTVAEMCLIRLCTPRLDDDNKGLSLRLEKLEKRLDEIEKKGITVAAKAEEEMPPAFMMARTMPAPPTPPTPPIPPIPPTPPIPAIVPQTPEEEILAATPVTLPLTDEDYEQMAGQPMILPAFEGDADFTIPEGNMDQTETASAQPEKKEEEQTAPPAWLFEGDDNSGYGTYVPMYPDDDPIADNRYDSTVPPFDIDIGGTDMAEPVAQPAEPDTAEEEPPFDLDEPVLTPPTEVIPQPLEAPPPPEVPAYVYEDSPAPHLKEKMAAAGDYAEVLERIPALLRAMLKQVTVNMADGKILISDYTSFHKDFIKSKTYIEDLKKAAQQVTGRPHTVVFDESGTDSADGTESNDPFSAFMAKAQEMGVNIKHKTKKL